MAKRTKPKPKRTKRVDDNKIDRLPHEVFLDIFCRLPITSLVQFRLVCRGWNKKLSNDSELVKLQLSHTVKNDPCLIFNSRNQLYFADLSDLENNDKVMRLLTLPFSTEFTVITSCNGLLCIYSPIFLDTLYIYNPFTGNYKELAKFTAVEVPFVATGFGFHPSTKEYKVVRIVYYLRTTGTNFVERSATRSDVQILDLSSNKWRSIGQIPYLLRTPSTGVLVNGRLHWVTKCCTGRPIVSFDLGDEGFQEIPIPDFRDSLTKLTTIYRISVLRGRLSASLSCPSSDVSLQIWVMKEYNVKESWECVCSITANSLMPDLQNDESVSALCRLKNGVILLLNHQDGTLVSYDPKSKETRNFMLKGMPDYCIPMVHVGSLSWIDS